MITTVQASSIKPSGPPHFTESDGDAFWVRLDGTLQLSAGWDVGDQIISGIGRLDPAATGARDIGTGTSTWRTTFTRTVSPDSGQSLTLTDSNGVAKIAIAAGVTTFNAPGGDADHIFEGDTDVNLLTIDAELDRVGVGIGSGQHLGKLHVDQNSASGAIPVLALSQSDIDDSFIDFRGTSAADGSRSISSDTTEDAAKFGAFQVEINGVRKWIRVYDDES